MYGGIGRRQGRVVTPCLMLLQLTGGTYMCVWHSRLPVVWDSVKQDIPVGLFPVQKRYWGQPSLTLLT